MERISKPFSFVLIKHEITSKLPRNMDYYQHGTSGFIISITICNSLSISFIFNEGVKQLITFSSGKTALLPLHLLLGLCIQIHLKLQ